MLHGPMVALLRDEHAHDASRGEDDEERGAIQQSGRCFKRVRKNKKFGGQNDGEQHRSAGDQGKKGPPGKTCSRFLYHNLCLRNEVLVTLYRWKRV